MGTHDRYSKWSRGVRERGPNLMLGRVFLITQRWYKAHSIQTGETPSHISMGKRIGTHLSLCNQRKMNTYINEYVKDANNNKKKIKI